MITVPFSWFMSISDNKDRDKGRREENRKLRHLFSILHRQHTQRICAYFSNHLSSLLKLIDGILFVSLDNKNIYLLDSCN